MGCADHVDGDIEESELCPPEGDGKSSILVDGK
jgi:hypothetical protein